MRPQLLIVIACIVLLISCRKTGTARTSVSANYDSISFAGGKPFINSQVCPQIAISSGKQILFAIDATPRRISDSVLIFDTGTNQWSVTEMPSCHPLAGVTAVDNQIIFAGGQAFPNLDGVSDVEIYTPSPVKWTTATLSQARYNLAAASAGSIAAFGGGQTLSEAGVATVDLYNATTGSWTISALSVPRSALAAAGAGTKIVFAGGVTPDHLRSDLVDIYDTRTGLWTTSHLSVPRDEIAATVVGHQLIFAGGSTIGGFSDAVDIYDVSTGEWSVSQLPQPCTYFGGAVSSGNLACFLSRVTASGIDDTVDIYNTSIGNWNSAGILPANRTTICGAAAGNHIITMGWQEGQSTTAYYYTLK